MKKINISDEKERDAVVGLNPKVYVSGISYVYKDKSIKNTRVAKGSLDSGIGALTEKAGNLDNVARLLTEGDPEIDFDLTGKKLSYPQKIFLKDNNEIALHYQLIDITRDVDGTEKERKPHESLEQNISGENPVRWTGKYFSKKDAIKKFVFTRKYQITHVSGLTYEFLYDMAKELEEKKVLMLVGGGQKGKDPLVMSSGGRAYRGFLEGRTEGKKYCLILHLTNLELKEIIK
jgi:hypothetical protein